MADIVTAGRWPLRTPHEAEQLQREADAVAGAAAATESAAATAERRAPDPTAALRAAVKFCEARGIRWCGTRSVLWCAPAPARRHLLERAVQHNACKRAPAVALPLQRRARACASLKRAWLCIKRLRSGASARCVRAPQLAA